MFILLDIYLIIGLLLMLVIYKIDENAREKLNRLLKECNMFYVITTITKLIIIMPIVTIMNLLKKK